MTKIITWPKNIAIISSLILLLLGLFAFFLPEELVLFLDEEAGSKLLVQLYGASLLGFAFANWHIRISPLGGIYGRAIVTGNIIHFLSGAGVLLGLILGGRTSAGVITAGFIYALLSAGFVTILLKGGISKELNNQ